MAAGWHIPGRANAITALITHPRKSLNHLVRSEPRAGTEREVKPSSLITLTSNKQKIRAQHTAWGNVNMHKQEGIGAICWPRSTHAAPPEAGHSSSAVCRLAGKPTYGSEMSRRIDSTVTAATGPHLSRLCCLGRWCAGQPLGQMGRLTHPGGICWLLS